MANNSPRTGTRGCYRVDDREPVGFTVYALEGNLCYAEYDDGTRGPFIWRSKDGLNNCHDWPGKNDERPEEA